jgi:hypothetical protein
MKTVSIFAVFLFALLVTNPAGAYSIHLQDVTGDPATAMIEIDGDGTPDVTFRVTLGQGTAGDIRGVFLGFASTPADISVSGSDVTRWVWRERAVTNLGGGVNMHGTGMVFDLGVVIGTPGIGKDDISSTVFTVSSSADIFLAESFGLRLTSVGPNDRDGSSKLAATGVVSVSEPATFLLLMAGLLGLAVMKRRHVPWHDGCL